MLMNRNMTSATMIFAAAIRYFIQKPIENEDLIERVNTIINYTR